MRLRCGSKTRRSLRSITYLLLGLRMARKLIQNVERYQIIGDEDFQFEHSIIIYTEGNDFFQARVAQRYKDSEIDLAKLPGIRIPPENIYPKFDGSNFSSIPEPVPGGCFLKRPNLIYYRADDVTQLYRVRERLLEEAQICEELSKSPHRNVACYMGCQVSEDRITSLCFKEYKKTLFDRAGRDLKEVDKHRCIADIRRGIEHIHSLGYCHNDVNPSNIMFDEDGTAVIIDFDSARPTGAELSFKTCTRGFGDMSVALSKASNDFQGLSKIEEWLDEICDVE